MPEMLLTANGTTFGLRSDFTFGVLTDIIIGIQNLHAWDFAHNFMTTETVSVTLDGAEVTVCGKVVEIYNAGETLRFSVWSDGTFHLINEDGTFAPRCLLSGWTIGKKLPYLFGKI